MIGEEAKPKPIVRKHPSARCEDCPLYAEGQFVPSDGPGKASLAIIGEAPGANEAKAGKPFIGESGQLLNSVLRHYKLNREEIFLSNACLCRSSDGATPTNAALQACRPRLVVELREREPKDIVVLGNSAAKSVLQTSQGITALRVGQGKYNEEEFPGVRVIPTFHPAYCLRSPAGFPSLVNDFGKLKGFFSTWYEPEWEAYDDEESALAALAELERFDSPVVVDIESNIEKDVSFETPLRHKLLCVGLGYLPGKVAVIGETALSFESVKDALRRYLQRRRLIGQNLKFDNKGLWAYFGIVLSVWFDTLLGSYALDERAGIHDLAYQGIERLGAPNWKHELDKYKKKGEGYGAIPRPVLYKYNAWDVHVTGMVALVIMKKLAAAGKPEPARRRADGQLWGLRDLHDFLCRASDQLMRIELNGIKIDQEYNNELMSTFDASLEVLEDRIVSAIPGDEWTKFNPRSPLQVKKVLKGVFGFRLPMKMNTKREYAETSDAETLQGFLEKSLEKPPERFLRGMLEYRKEHKLASTYVRGIRKRIWRGRVYPTFLLHRTTTGRLSCRNPNLQNIVRGSRMRKQFVPNKAGNVFVEGDFAQAEGRVICWLAQDEFLRDIFNDPMRDLFDELTPRLYGDTSALTSEQKTELRIRVKAYFYGLCVPQTSLILTRRGWLTCDEVTTEDETIGYDLDTQTTKWTRIREVYKYDEPYALVKIQSNYLSFICTPNHRWVVQQWRRWLSKAHPTRDYGPPQLRTTRDLTANSQIQLSAPFRSDDKLPISDIEAEILGWILSDGSAHLYRRCATQVIIYQACDSCWVSDIDRALAHAPHSRTNVAENMLAWRISSPYAKDLFSRAGMPKLHENLELYSPEDFILRMSDTQRKAFLRAFRMGDAVKLDQNLVVQAEGWTQRAFELAAFLQGYIVRWTCKADWSPWTKKPCWKFRLSVAKATGQRMKATPVAAAPVWCVKTDLGSWTMKQTDGYEGLSGEIPRPGNIVVTGNSYGREAYSISLEYDIPVSEGERGMREFFRVIPKTVAWRERTRQQILDGKDLITPTARRHRVWLVTRANRKDVLNEGLAFLPQSISSDICLDAMIHTRPRLKGIGWIRNIVHDSMLTECAPEHVQTVKAIMQEEMLAAAKRIVGDYVAFKVDFKSGPSWGELSKC